MSATTRDKLVFVAAMARHTSATVRQCEALMRYATAIQLHDEKARRDGVSLKEIARFNRIVKRVHTLCNEFRAGEAFSLRYHLESIKTNLTGRDYPQQRWQRSLQYANEALAGDFSDSALGELCVPEFTERLTIRVPGGEGIVVPS